MTHSLEKLYTKRMEQLFHSRLEVLNGLKDYSLRSTNDPQPSPEYSECRFLSQIQQRGRFIDKPESKADTNKYISNG
jgi:hypothetical protein